MEKATMEVRKARVERVLADFTESGIAPKKTWWVGDTIAGMEFSDLNFRAAVGHAVLLNAPLRALYYIQVVPCSYKLIVHA